MWKVKTGERAPLLCMLLVFTQYNGKLFMSPIIIHQEKEYYQYIHFNIPLVWIVHHTTSRYMDISRWLKSTTQLSNVYGAYTINNKILFFDGHDIQFYDFTLGYTEDQNIQNFVLNSGNSSNYQTNDNKTNEKLNYF